MPKFKAVIGLNLRNIGGKQLVLLNGVQAEEDTTFDRDHCHTEITPYIDRFLKRKVRHNRNRLVIQFEADIIEYFKPRSTVMESTVTNIKNIRILGRA